MFINIFLFFIMLLTLSGCDVSNNKNGNNGITNIATDKATFSGLAQLKEKSYSNLSVNGTAKLDNVLVTEKLVVNGSLSATESKIQEMQVNGMVDLHKVLVNGLSKINGYLNARDSNLDQIIISTEKITIYDSITKTITVKKPEKPVEQIIELHNAKVDGNVLFQGGQGKIVSKGNSKVLGKIEGGVLVKC